MALVLGLNAFTLRDSMDDISSPMWEIVTNVKDETINTDTALSDVTTRAANGWRLQVGTLSEASVDTQILYDTADADFTAFQTAFFAKTRIHMAFADGDITMPPMTPAKYSALQGGFAVTNFTFNRSLEEAVMVDVTFTAREDSDGNGPTWTEYSTP